jgi:amino-acid N-acetyltransferase
MNTCDPGRDEVIAMLRSEGLPVADLEAGREVRFIGLRDEGLAAVGGLEVYGDCALLRSLVTDAGRRGSGLGTRLLDVIEAEAARSGVIMLYLLTDTAAPFFAARGYAPLPREQAPAEIAATSQFANLCPAAAAFMVKPLRHAHH